VHGLNSHHNFVLMRLSTLTAKTRVYDILSSLMVWTMQSQNVDPSAARDLINNQIELTIETLRNRNLIGPGS
jgi:hypothetical protein